jgi:uncharacterized protein YqcC (DUF446 family)
MTEILQKALEIEAEMQRIGYWTPVSVRATDDGKLYGGLPFEEWLQFHFLPSVKAAATSGDFSSLPRYRIGLAALRNYDYHSTVEIALPLMRLCQQLEELLNRRLNMRSFECRLWSSMFGQRR